MSLIPEETYKTQTSINFAPMVDFLFLIVTAFAILAVSRSSLFDTQISLATTTESAKTTENTGRALNITINAAGQYAYLSEKGTQSASLDQLTGAIDLLKRHNGPFPIYLHIDKNASWNGVAKLIYAAKERGCATYPIYTAE